MRIQQSTIAASIIALGLCLACGSSATAQVVLEMPPPPKRAVPAPAVPVVVPESAATAPNATTVSTSSSTVTLANPISSTAPAYLARPASTPSVGQVALFRYSSARRGTRDTFFNDGSFFNNGIRFISVPRFFPQFVWGPWGGWSGWGGWGWWGGSWPGRCR